MKKGDKKDISAKEKVQTSKTNHIPAEHDRSAVPDHAEGRPAEAGKSTEREDRKLMEEKLLRLRADFDNFRKRMLREKNELYRRANEELILELLPVFDHLELALTAAEEHEAHGAFVEGFSLVSEQLMSVLKKFGLTPIDAEGLQFDPKRHEAISYLPSDKFPENAVIMQVRRGYMLGGKLLRAAQVVVCCGTQRTEDNAERGTPTQAPPEASPRRDAEFCPEQTPSSREAGQVRASPRQGGVRVPSSNADGAPRTTDHGQQRTEKEEE